jgi:sigma-E factor negative regulatory protein RseA
MNEKISALMDGELDREEARDAIRLLGQTDQYREKWDTFHLIGEVLRGDEHAAERVDSRRKRTESIFAALDKEPTVFAPAAAKSVAAASKVSPKTRVALAMAASVATLSAIVVVAFYQQSGSTVSNAKLVQQVAPQPLAVPVANQASPAEMRVNDYLAIHRQFAGQDFQTAANRPAERAPAQASGR